MTERREVPGDRRVGLTRRHFLILSGAFVVPLLARPRPLALIGDPTDEGSDGAADRLAGLFRRPDSARVVGLEYLRVSPAERTVDALVSSIAASLPGGSQALDDPIDPADLRDLLGDRIYQDFAEDAIVDLRGWIVSRTEARLCAIAALG